MMQGDGLFQWPDGRIYYGTFEGGKKHGKGIFMWPNGHTYVGDFKQDECQGLGKIYYPDGKIFEGNWAAGKKNGSCTYSWPNGAKYIITYKNGVSQNDGKLLGGADVQKIKAEYASLAKKTSKSINFLKEKTFKIDDKEESAIALTRKKLAAPAKEPVKPKRN